MGTPTDEADLRAFMSMLPPAARMRVAEIARGRPELDTRRIECAETLYQRVTGRRPSITLDHARSATAAFEDGTLSGIWCGGTSAFPAPGEARTELRALHRALMVHGVLYLAAGHPGRESADTGESADAADELLAALAATGFHSAHVGRGTGGICVLALKKSRCCDDGPRRIYDSHAVL
ncbi:hypothetical protein ACQUSR_14850 [Streptomyces sp. P1-3]|uniref:hypothetical protein n=1 Tax=Streptomyces sp. P1-3 TaxID=3421658 RepID=UPI003D362941